MARKRKFVRPVFDKIAQLFHIFVSGQSEMLEYAVFKRVAGLRGMPGNLTNGEDP
jgi:hypothetical protein